MKKSSEKLRYQHGVEELGKASYKPVPIMVQKQISHDDEKQSAERDMKKANSLMNKLLSDKKKRADTISNRQSLSHSLERSVERKSHLTSIMDQTGISNRPGLPPHGSGAFRLKHNPLSSKIFPASRYTPNYMSKMPTTSKSMQPGRGSKKMKLKTAE